MTEEPRYMIEVVRVEPTRKPDMHGEVLVRHVESSPFYVDLKALRPIGSVGRDLVNALIADIDAWLVSYSDDREIREVMARHRESAVHPAEKLRALLRREVMTDSCDRVIRAVIADLERELPGAPEPTDG